MSKAAKRNLIILMVLLLASLGFAGYIVLEKGKLEKKVTFLDGELTKADKREKASLQKIGALKKDVDSITSQKATIEKKLKSTEAKVSSKDNEINELKKEVETVLASKNKIERRMDIVRKERDKLTKELTAEKTKKPEVKIVYRDRPVEEKPKEETKQAMKKSSSESMSTDGESDAYWASVLKQKAELQVQLDTVKKELSTASLEIVELKQANADLQIELDDFQLAHHNCL